MKESFTICSIELEFMILVNPLCSRNYWIDCVLLKTRFITITDVPI